MIAVVAATLFEFSPQHARDGSQIFGGPSGIACDVSGKVLVVDDLRHRLVFLDPTGQFVSAVGSPGDRPGHLRFPDAARPDEAGNIVIADTGANRIQVWNSAGSFMREFGRYTGPGRQAWRRAVLLGSVAFSCAAGLLLGFLSLSGASKKPAAILLIPGLGLLSLWAGISIGSPRTLHNPRDVLVNADGSVWVADFGSDAVRRFDRRGRLLFTRREAGASPLRAPLGLAGKRDRLYVTDSGNHRVIVLDGRGDFVAAFGRQGTAPGELDTPHGIAVGPDNRLYVADRGNQRVQVFAEDGSALQVIQSDPNTGVGSFTPTGLCVTPDGLLLIVDIAGHRVLGWRPPA